MTTPCAARLLMVALPLVLLARDARTQPASPAAERTLAEWVTLLTRPEPKGEGDLPPRVEQFVAHRRLVQEAEHHLREAGEPAVPFLLAALEKSIDPEEIETLAGALAGLRQQASAAIPTLERRLTEGSEGGRFALAAALARIDPRPDSPALPHLERCLADRSEASPRLTCIFALGDLPGGAGATALIATLDDESEILRQSAIESLGSAPDALVRAPLEGRLNDTATDVRLVAAARLAASEPPVSPAAFETLARELCLATPVYAELAVGTLRKRHELPPAALALLGEGLRSPVPLCRQWTAVLLAKLDAERGASPQVLDLLAVAVASESGYLRYEAGWAVAELGCAAGRLYPALAAAAKIDPDLAPALERLAQSPVVPEQCTLGAASLVVTGESQGSGYAILFDATGPMWVVAGEKYLDGEVALIEPGVVSIRQRRLDGKLAFVDDAKRLELFTRHPPQPIPEGLASDGDRIDVDFEGDVGELLRLLAKGRHNVLLEPNASGAVRLAVRRAPAGEGLLAHALQAAGFSWRRLGSFAVIGKGDGHDFPRQALDLVGEPINLSLDDVSLEDVFESLGRAFDFEFVLPAAASEARVTVYCEQVNWPEIVEALVVSRGWSHRLEGKRIVVTPSRG